MPSASTHAAALARLLPQGPAWAPSDQTDGADPFSLLLNALSQEPARLDASVEALLEQIIPDNAQTDLDAWERIVGAPTENLTDVDRLARIRGILVNSREVTQAYLELAAQQMAGDSNVKLFNRTGPRCAVGASNVGDRLRVGEWDFAWLCELWPNVLGVTPDDFAAWTGFSGVSNAAQRSPVTLLQTADSLTIPFGSFATTPLVGTDDDDTVYSSFWIYANSSTPRVIEVSYLKRDGTSGTATAFTLTGQRWHKISHSAALGAGATAPLLRVAALVGAQAAYLSWAVAGVVDTPLQARISALFPIHTRGHFAVQGEYTTLLANGDQLAVMW